MSPRCWCGHPRSTHDHYRPGSDCGECGVARCHRYAGRDKPMPPGHAVPAALSDAHFYLNLAVLAEYAQSARQIAATRIPQQRPNPNRSVVAYLEQKRIAHRKGPRRG